MRDLVIHRSGLELDFGAEDFGGYQQAAIVRDWLDLSPQEKRRRNLDGREFICFLHQDHPRPGLYLQSRYDGRVVIAAHWPNSGLADTHQIVHGVSDEHKRQVEYLQRAGVAAGYTVKTEVRLPTRVTSDAVIYGDVNMGVEVQRSALTVREVKRRTTNAHRAGVKAVWFSDSGMKLPPWFYQVPSVAMNVMSWDTLPRQRSVTVVSGVRVIEAVHCQDFRNGPCPNRSKGCNRYHPDHWPRLDTLADDLAELVPAGELVTLLHRSSNNREQMFLVSPAHRALYEELTGQPAGVPLLPRKAGRPRGAERITCTSNVGELADEVAIRRAAGACPAHAHWPDSTFRCWIPGCPGRERVASAFS